MLIPEDLFMVREYDAVYVVSPTSKYGHNSDSIFGTVEMLVENTRGEDITFPFTVLNTDPGTGAEDRGSVEPKVINGSRPVDLADEVDEGRLAELVVQRAREAGYVDEAKLDLLRRWARQAFGRAERTKIGRTRIKAGERRRIVLQQRTRVLPDAEGRFTFETIAPSPIAALVPGGRISLAVLLPWDEGNLGVQILERTEGYEVEQGQLKRRQTLAWRWQYDPVFRLVYRYA